MIKWFVLFISGLVFAQLYANQAQQKNEDSTSSVEDTQNGRSPAGLGVPQAAAEVPFECSGGTKKEQQACVQELSRGSESGNQIEIN